VTRVKLEWPTPWIEDESLQGMEKLKRAKTEVSVTALLLRKEIKEREENDSEDLDSDSEEEWEQEFIFKQEEDTYELPLKGGHYMVVVRYPELQQVHEHLFVSPLEDCNTVLHHQLELVQQKQIFVSVKDSDLHNVQGALVKMQHAGSRVAVEGLTDADGVVEFSVLPNSTYTFTALKKGLFGAPVDFIFTHDNHKSLKEVKLFLSSPSRLESAIELLITSSTLRANQDYELHLFTCQNADREDEPHAKDEFKLNSSQRTDGEGCLVRTDEPEFGLSALMFPTNEDHWYRVVLRILNNGVLDGEHDVENLDPSFTSKLQSSNLNVQVFA
jgi:hypothetical protein